MKITKDVLLVLLLEGWTAKDQNERGNMKILATVSVRPPADSDERPQQMARHPLSVLVKNKLVRRVLIPNGIEWKLTARGAEVAEELREKELAA